MSQRKTANTWNKESIVFRNGETNRWNSNNQSLLFSYQSDVQIVISFFFFLVTSQEKLVFTSVSVFTWGQGRWWKQTKVVLFVNLRRFCNMGDVYRRSFDIHSYMKKTTKNNWTIVTKYLSKGYFRKFNEQKVVSTRKYNYLWLTCRVFAKTKKIY